MRTPLFIASCLALSLVACGDTASGTTGGTVTTSKASASASATAAAPSASASSADASATATATATASAVASASASASPAEGHTGTATAASAAPSGEPVVGEKKTNGSAYTAYMSAAKSYKAGKPGAVTVVVNAGEGYHINKEYPYKVKLDAPPAGVSYPSDTIRDVNRSEKTATMSVPFNADAAGSATISGTCSFSVCTDANCVIDKVPVSVTVKIE
jgi:hypothetical protein